jgi:prevent-host-death family protein
MRRAKSEASVTVKGKKSKAMADQLTTVSKMRLLNKVSNIIPITDLRQDAASVLKRVKGTKEPVIITQRGRAAAVMMSTDAYEKAEHDRQLLRLLARGEKEIAAGKGYDLETVMAEADRLLAED